MKNYFFVHLFIFLSLTCLAPVKAAIIEFDSTQNRWKLSFSGLERISDYGVKLNPEIASFLKESLYIPKILFGIKAGPFRYGMVQVSCCGQHCSTCTARDVWPLQEIISLYIDLIRKGDLQDSRLSNLLERWKLDTSGYNGDEISSKIISGLVIDKIGKATFSEFVADNEIKDLVRIVDSAFKAYGVFEGSSSIIGIESRYMREERIRRYLAHLDDKIFQFHYNKALKGEIKEDETGYSSSRDYHVARYLLFLTAQDQHLGLQYTPTWLPKHPSLQMSSKGPQKVCSKVLIK